VILKYDGKDVDDTGHLRNMVSQTAVGSKVKVTLLRKKKEMELEVTIAELPKKLGEVSTDEEQRGDAEGGSALAGVTVRELTPDLARRFGLGDVEGGVVVVRIEPDSPAYVGGVRPGDMILQINQRDVTTLDDFRNAVAKLKKKDRALLLIRRKGQELFLTIRTE